MSFHSLSTSGRSPSTARATRLLLGGLFVFATALAGCNAVIAGGTVAVVAVVAFVGYGCGEPVDVTVWDRKTAHPVCDATVTAEQDGSVHEFSPCYRLHLGDGAWKVKASKPGYVTAEGVVTVNKERRCSEPTFHSVALTLVPVGEPAPVIAPLQPPSPATPPAPAPAPAPSAAPPPGTAPAQGAPLPPSAASAPSAVTPAPASS